MTTTEPLHSAPPWWTAFVELTVELGIGGSGDTAVAQWDRATWDDAGSDWAGLEPEWTAVSNCRVLEVGIERGRSRSLDRFGVSSMTVTALDPDGWLTWDPATESMLEVRPGRSVRLQARMVETDETVTLWRGWIEALEDTFVPFEVPAAQLTAQDALAQVAHTNEPELPSPVGAGERSDERVGRLLDLAGWPAERRELEVGQITVQGTNLARSVADDLGITADSEGGALYASRDDHVVFRNREWLTTDPVAVVVQATIGGALHDVCAAAYAATRRGSEILNDLQIGRAGGTAQRFTDEDSISLYHRRSYQRTDYVCEFDDQIAILGERMLQAWARARVRIPAVTITPRTADEYAFVCSVDYGWRLQLNYTAEAVALGDTRALRSLGQSWTRDVHVQGVRYSITPDGWTVELRVDDAGTVAADGWNGPRGWNLAVWSKGAP